MSHAENALTAIIPPKPLAAMDYRDWITDVESKMMASEHAVDRHAEDSPFPLRHVFTPGLYGREIFMPKGSLVVSRIHLHEHPYLLSQGHVTVYDGVSLQEIKAPFMGTTQPGTKRILYMHEDTIWTTFHVTDKETFEEIDADGVITCGSYDTYDLISSEEDNPCLGQQSQ